MKKMILLIAVLAVIAAGWFLYLSGGETLTFVGVYEVKYMDLENALEFSGEVCPAALYNVMSETGGTVANLKVSEGAKVKAGDVLLELDNTDINAQLKDARLRANMLRDMTSQAALAQQGGAQGIAEEKAKLALALSQTTGYDYESFNETFGSETAQQIQAVTASLAEDLTGLGINSTQDGALSDSQVELAENAVQRLENLLSKMSIKSEIKGTVIAVNVNKGEVLSPGLPAMVVADTYKSIITGYVYEKDVENLKAGMDVSIITDTRVNTGKIKKIGVSAMDIEDSSSAFDTMTKIEVEPDKDFKKILGAVVDLKVVLSSKENVLAIPVDCFTSDGCVFVLDAEDIAHKRAIVTGFEDAFYVEVIGGLGEGERIVSSPKNVQEGQRLDYDRSE